MLRTSLFGGIALTVGAAMFGFTQRAQASTIYGTQVLARSPIIYLPLDDSSGTVANDASGNGYHGAYLASDTLGQASASAATGTAIHTPSSATPVNSAIPVKLTNSNGAIAALNAIGTGDFSIEFWFNTSNVTDREDLFDLRGTTGSPVSDFGITLSNGSAGKLSVFHTSGTQISANGAGDPSVTANAWHQLAVTRSGTSLQLYLDGANIGPTATDSQTFAIDTAGALAFGNKTSGSPHMVLGLLDEFAIYNSALSSSDIASDFALGVPEPASLGLLMCLAAAITRRRAHAR
jgi:hypothetical protein